MSEPKKYNDPWNGHENVTIVGDAPPPWHGWVEAETTDDGTYYVEFRHLVPIMSELEKELEKHGLTPAEYAESVKSHNEALFYGRHSD